MVRITVRNFRYNPQRHRVVLKMPPGIEAEPPELEGTVPPKSRASFDVKLHIRDRKAVGEGVLIAPLDITLDGKRYGELFDFMLRVREPAK